MPSAQRYTNKEKKNGPCKLCKYGDIGEVKYYHAQ